MKRWRRGVGNAVGSGEEVLTRGERLNRGRGVGGKKYKWGTASLGSISLRLKRPLIYNRGLPRRRRGKSLRARTTGLWIRKGK